jgi:hypothetical protein
LVAIPGFVRSNGNFAGGFTAANQRKDEMITIASRSRLDDVGLELNHTLSQLDQLERSEWWRWSVAFVVMLTLTLGLFALSLPTIGGRSWSEQWELGIALRGLLGFVLLFEVFSVYQQTLTSRSRRELSTRLRVLTTLETLDKADEDRYSQQKESRRMQRSGLDRRVRVSAFRKGKQTFVHGRIRDISAEGMGAVIPCSLSVDEQVTLEFAMDDGGKFNVPALVRHCQGFQFGFEFLSVEPSLREALARRCE